MIKILCAISAIGITLGCTRATPLQAIGKSHDTSSDFVAVVIRVLETSGQSGSLVYRGDCAPSGGITDSFKVATPKNYVSAINGLHDAFADESALTAKEDGSGLIRVVGGHVQTDLLDLRIHQVVFHAVDDPRDATYRLSALPEVKAYMQDHHVRFTTVLDGIFAPSRGVRLNETLQDVTLS